MREKEKRLNEAITAREISVISDEGEPLGILSREEALAAAQERDMDLVEIGERDGLTLAKIMDYGKHLFRQQKNQSKNRTTSKKAEMKTVKITYKIGDHDLNIRATQVRKFLAAKHPVKIMLQLRGRENQFGDLAFEKITQFVRSLEDVCRVEGGIKKLGNAFNVIIHPKN